MSRLMPTFTTRIPASHEALSSIRADVARWLVAGTHGATAHCADLELVLTELAANVVDHTTSPWVGIDLEIDDGRAVLTVSALADVGDVPPLAAWGTIEGGDRGHGLRIIKAICDSIEISGDVRQSSIRCRLPLG